MTRRLPFSEIHRFRKNNRKSLLLQNIKDKRHKMGRAKI
jgi:hypothetical protein